MSRSRMKTLGLGLLLASAALVGGSCVESPTPTDGMLIHVTHGGDDPHRVLMALNMAAMMADERAVMVYFDIAGVEVVMADGPDLEYAHFPSSHAALATLREKGVPMAACPGCLKAAGKSAADLAEGVRVAEKEQFFTFASGRIVTLDY